MAGEISLPAGLLGRRGGRAQGALGGAPLGLALAVPDGVHQVKVALPPRLVLRGAVGHRRGLQGSRQGLRVPGCRAGHQGLQGLQKRQPFDRLALHGIIGVQVCLYGCGAVYILPLSQFPAAKQEPQELDHVAVQEIKRLQGLQRPWPIDGLP